MSKVDRSHDPELEVALKTWGNDVNLPPTPNLSASVSARLRAQDPSSTRHGWRPVTYISLAACLAAALVVAAAVILHQGSPNRPNAIPSPTPSTGDLTPSMVLAGAVNAPAYRYKIIHDVYAVRAPHGGKTGSHRINVWSGLVAGRVATVDIQRHPRVVARRYVSGPAGIATRWMHRPLRRETVLRALSGTILDGLDGRLIARRILSLRSESGWRVSGKVVIQGGREVYSLSAWHVGRLVVNLRFDAKSKELLRATAPGVSIRLLSHSIVALPTEPQLVTAYLRGRSTPNESSSIGAY